MEENSDETVKYFVRIFDASEYITAEIFKNFGADRVDYRSTSGRPSVHSVKITSMEDARFIVSIFEERSGFSEIDIFVSIFAESGSEIQEVPDYILKAIFDIRCKLYLSYTIFS